MPSANPPLIAGASRYGYLDSLRGIAALLVLVYHTLRAYERTNWPVMLWEKGVIAFCNDWFNFGKFGVAVFFIVSGFVIPSSLRRDRDRPLFAFLISRIARLYPAYWVSIACAIVAYQVVGGLPFSFTTVAINLTMIQQFVGQDNVLDVYWTLQLEIIFYILCAFLFRINLLSNTKAIEIIGWGFLTVAVVFSVARWGSGLKIPVAVPLALFLMFLGYLFRGARVDGDKLCRAAAIRLLAGFVVLMPIIALLAYNRDMGYGERWYSYTLSYYSAVAFTTLAIFVFSIKSNLAEWLGKVSYSVYLFHYVVIMLVVYSLTEIDRVPSGIIEFLFIIIAVTLSVSIVVYKSVELPFVGLGKAISARFSGSRFTPDFTPKVEKAL